MLEVCLDLVRFVALTLLWGHSDVVSQFPIAFLWGARELSHFSALDKAVFIVASLKKVVRWSETYGDYFEQFLTFVEVHTVVVGKFHVKIGLRSGSCMNV